MRQIILIIITVSLTFEVFAQKNIDKSRVIEPYLIEVGYNKTVHVIFPSSVKYVDLGSADLIASRADGAENVVRIKSAVERFAAQTNFSVITDDGIFYSFVALYSDNPQSLSIDMGKSIADSMVYVCSEPLTISKIMADIHKDNISEIRHIGSKRFGIELLLKGIYIHENLFFIHVSLSNLTAVTFDVDYIRFRIIDKKISRRTVIQENMIEPITCSEDLQRVVPQQELRGVYVFRKFTIPDDKVVVMDVFEKNGGRHQSFTIFNNDLIRTRHINKK